MKEISTLIPPHPLALWLRMQSPTPVHLWGRQFSTKWIFLTIYWSLNEWPGPSRKSIYECHRHVKTGMNLNRQRAVAFSLIPVSLYPAQYYSSRMSYVSNPEEKTSFHTFPNNTSHKTFLPPHPNCSNILLFKLNNHLSRMSLGGMPKFNSKHKFL